MCGICGIWGADGRQAIDPMVAAMRHRGPDDQGVYHDAKATLGMTRLAIIDVSAAGQQPMQNRNGTVWIVYNGELYNFQRERGLLEAKGYSFSSSSDTEVVLHMYEHYGDDFVSRLRGMFALAIYDKRRGPGRERLLVARDHLGIKPLLFARVGDRLVFASEIKALLASGLIKPEIDPVALRMLLTYGSVYQPRTILRGVSMLLPAHRMIIEQSKQRIERYWSLSIDRWAGLRERPYEELVAEVADVLEESVRLQMMSDVPLGAFLSGGVDSSLLVAMMARMSSHKVKTFSVGFEEEGVGIDESEDAERTARFLDTDHTRVIVQGTEVRDRIQHIASSLGQPSVDGVNSYFVSLAARQAVTVAISGTGGDELFAGYPWFISMVLDRMRYQAEPWRAMSRSLLTAIAGLPAFDPLLLRRGGGRLWNARKRAGFLTKYATLYQIFGALGAARLLAPELRKPAQAGRSPHYDLRTIDELPEGSAIERVTGVCLRGYMNNQLLRDIDAVSMAHSLEVRVPYLDPVVADTALSLPDSAKMSDLTKLPTAEQRTYRETGAKRILIDVGREFLPKDFDLQPKRGFAMPLDSWLRGPLREVLRDTLSEEQIRRRGLLDVQEASAIKNRFLEGSLSWAQPWLMMILELWCREVLDQPSSAYLKAAQS
jgi:asparagine synthase (glutamine-hydrolysing)